MSTNPQTVLAGIALNLTQINTEEVQPRNPVKRKPVAQKPATKKPVTSTIVPDNFMTVMKKHYGSRILNHMRYNDKTLEQGASVILEIDKEQEEQAIYPNFNYIDILNDRSLQDSERLDRLKQIRNTHVRKLAVDPKDIKIALEKAICPIMMETRSLNGLLTTPPNFGYSPLYDSHLVTVQLVLKEGRITIRQTTLACRECKNWALACKHRTYILRAVEFFELILNDEARSEHVTTPLRMKTLTQTITRLQKVVNYQESKADIMERLDHTAEQAEQMLATHPLESVKQVTQRGHDLIKWRAANNNELFNYYHKSKGVDYRIQDAEFRTWMEASLSEPSRQARHAYSDRIAARLNHEMVNPIPAMEASHVEEMITALETPANPMFPVYKNATNNLLSTPNHSLKPSQRETFSFEIPIMVPTPESAAALKEAVYVYFGREFYADMSMKKNPWVRSMLIPVNNREVFPRKYHLRFQTQQLLDKSRLNRSTGSLDGWDVIGDMLHIAKSNGAVACDNDNMRFIVSTRSFAWKLANKIELSRLMQEYQDVLVNIANNPHDSQSCMTAGKQALLAKDTLGDIGIDYYDLQGRFQKKSKSSATMHDDKVLIQPQSARYSIVKFDHFWQQYRSSVLCRFWQASLDISVLQTYYAITVAMIEKAVMNVREQGVSLARDEPASGREITMSKLLQFVNTFFPNTEMRERVVQLAIQNDNSRTALLKDT